MENGLPYFSVLKRAYIAIFFHDETSCFFIELNELLEKLMRKCTDTGNMIFRDNKKMAFNQGVKIGNYAKIFCFFKKPLF